MQFRRDAHVFVGVDIHKRHHTAVVVDSYGEPMGKRLTFANSTAAFPAWLEQVRKRAEGLAVVYGLEDVHGLGRPLAHFLLQGGHQVKFANAYLTKGERDSVNKTDRHDALAIARITAQHFKSLPDACIDDLQWALSQAVQHRRGLVEQQTRVKNRLHALLQQTHPTYETFFTEPFGKTALALWERYPSPHRLVDVTIAELTQFLQEQSHFALGQQLAEKILATVQPGAAPPFQAERDLLVRSAVKELWSLHELLRAVHAQLSRLVAQTDYHLIDIPGIDVVMAAELIALVGDVTRFQTVDKFLAYTGIAPVIMATGSKETRLRSQFGRRELMALFYRIASTQLVVHARTSKPRNPEAKAYFQKRLGEQAGLAKSQQDRKVRKKALLSLMRQQAIRFFKLMKAQKVASIAHRAAPNDVGAA